MTNLLQMKKNKHNTIKVPKTLHVTNSKEEAKRRRKVNFRTTESA